MYPEYSSIQPSLSDFPDEILLNVVSHLNDRSFLNVAQTCNRFRAIAKEAFGKKYCGHRHGKYKIKILCDNDVDDEKRYRPFLCTFGENIGAIEITFDAMHLVSRNHWIYDRLEEYCSSLLELDIIYGEGIDLTRIMLQLPLLTRLCVKMSEYLDTRWTGHSFPHLKSFVLYDACVVSKLGRNFGGFFDKNRQLTELIMVEYDGRAITAADAIDCLNGKLNLELLELGGYSAVTSVESKIVRMDKLQYLTLIGVYATYSILSAISKGCKNIKRLTMIPEWNVEWNGAIIPIICSLEQLTKLKFSAPNIRAVELQRLIDELTNLSRLTLRSVSCKSNIFNELPNIISSGGAKLVKVKLEVSESDCSISLSIESIKIMAALTRLNERLKIMVPSGRDTIVFIGGEVRRGKSVIYSDQLDRMIGQSTTNMLDLNDPSLEKIVSILDAESKCALYNSCTRMQNIVANNLSTKVFRASSDATENVLQTIGHHIARILIAHYDVTLWRNVNQHCPAVTELTAAEYSLSLNNQTIFVWPNVKKLFITIEKKLTYRRLRTTFVCPILEHLEISNLAADGGTMQTIDKYDHEDAFRHLTTLKFGCYNEAVTKFLLGFDTTICQQMKVLSLNNVSEAEFAKSIDDCRQLKRTNSQLLNILIRFRNLSTLNMLVPGLADLNTRHLFENCTKLVHIEFCQYWWNEDDDDIFEQIKENCKEIQFIRVVGGSISFDPSRWLEIARTRFLQLKIQVDKMHVNRQNLM